MMSTTLAQWLTTDRPASRAQARFVRFTLSARALMANRLAMVGLAIVLASHEPSLLEAIGARQIRLGS